MYDYLKNSSRFFVKKINYNFHLTLQLQFLAACHKGLWSMGKNVNYTVHVLFSVTLRTVCIIHLFV